MRSECITEIRKHVFQIRRVSEGAGGRGTNTRETAGQKVKG